MGAAQIFQVRLCAMMQTLDLLPSNLDLDTATVCAPKRRAQAVAVPSPLLSEGIDYEITLTIRSWRPRFRSRDGGGGNKTAASESSGGRCETRSTCR